MFRPVPPDSLTFARYDKETPYGEASIEWRKENGRFEMTVQVPVGCTATVWVPGAGLPIRYRPMSAGQAETRIFRSRASVTGMRCTRSVRAATAFGSNRPVAVFERGPAGSGSVFVG